MVVAVSGGETKVAINGQKLLKLLGISEEDLKKLNASEIISQILFDMSDEERVSLFNESLVKTGEDILSLCWNTPEYVIDEKCMLEYVDSPHRTSTEIKRDIKRCKNYLQKKELEKELQMAYKYEKTGCYC